MIELVDQHIISRFTAIKMDGTTIPVYAPGASRPKGKTKTPSVAVSRYLPFDIDVKQARPHIEVFTPSEEQHTVLLDDHMGASALGMENDAVEMDRDDITADRVMLGELTGPASWTFGPPPTPIELYYQIDLIATTQAHADALLVMLLEALPCPYRPKIGTRNVLIVPNGPPVNLDELEKPCFRTAARYTVSNVWIDRKDKFTKPSIADVEMEMGTEG